MLEINDTLFIIPARGGSKGLPQKNILPINGKPLICYTIDAARGVSNDENICVSTNDNKIKHIQLEKKRGECELTSGENILELVDKIFDN